MKQLTSGIVLMIGAAALFLYNATDTIADLKQWHDATNPAIAAVLLKQAASVVMSAVGGSLLPQLGAK